MKRSPVAPILAASLALAGCQTTNPQVASVIAQPTTPITKNITSFSQALRCMDELFLAYGKTGLVITSDGLPDQTQQINSGTKDMMITTLSKMSERSGAFKFVDIEQGGAVEFVQTKLGRGFDLPHYYIRGAITQVDRNVASNSKSAGIAIPMASLGYSSDQLLSVVTIDMNIGDVVERQIIPGLHTTNTITVVSSGKGTDAEGIIQKASIYFEVSQDRTQGTHQAVRTLVELGLIEVLGKLTKVPYWRCLGIESTNPSMIQQARDWYDQIPEGERLRIVQQAMSSSGLYSGPVDGVMGPAFRDAVNAYKARNDLIANGQVDFDLYYRLLVDNAAVMPHGPATPGKRGGPRQEVAYAPMAPGRGETVTEAVGSEIGLSLEPEGGRQANFRIGDRLSFLVSVKRPAEVYCYYQFEEGDKPQLVRIFPNRFQPNPLVRPGETVRVPGNDGNFRIVLSKAGAAEEVACIAKEGGYPRGTAPSLVGEGDLKPLTAPYAFRAVNLHLEADRMKTDVQSVKWRVR